MLLLINRCYTTSIQVKYRDELPLTQIHYRGISAAETLSFEYTGAFKLGDALMESAPCAHEAFQAQTDAWPDIVTCLCEHWWQYRNTIYSYMPSSNHLPTDTSLGSLEFYVQRFSLEMNSFLNSLPPNDKAVLTTALTGNIPVDFHYFEELRAAQLFEMMRQETSH